jgi:hypothetical protein
MRHFVTWLSDDGTTSGLADWSGMFDDCVPSIGDRFMQHLKDDDGVDCMEVVERYLGFDTDDNPVWLIVFRHIETPAGRDDFLRRAIREADEDREAKELERKRMWDEAVQKIRSQKPKR